MQNPTLEKKAIQGPTRFNGNDSGNDSFDLELDLGDTDTVDFPHLALHSDDESDDIDFYMGDDPQELNFD